MTTTAAAATSQPYQTTILFCSFVRVTKAVASSSTGGIVIAGGGALGVDAAMALVGWRGVWSNWNHAYLHAGMEGWDPPVHSLSPPQSCQPQFHQRVAWTSSARLCQGASLKYGSLLGPGGERRG